MPDFFSQIEVAFHWVLRSSLQASLLVLLILSIQALLGSRLSARWRYGLWLVVIVRMILPWAPESHVSMFGMTRPVERALVSQAAIIHPLPEVSGPPPPNVMQPTGVGIAAPETVSRKFLWPNRTQWAALGWLLGALALTLYAARRNLLLWRDIRRRRPVTDPRHLQLLEECKESVGVRTPISLVAASDFSAPALVGVLRPRLVIPEGRLDDQDLRFVFLHELCHLKRRDVLMNWLMLVLQVTHWFNPLVWWAFRRMLADREAACDALALSRVGADHARDYGRTILRLLERVPRTAFIPGAAGILEDKQQLRRRITMITQFTPGAYRWSVAGLAVIALVAVVGLTNPARSAAVTQQDPVAKEKTSQDVDMGAARGQSGDDAAKRVLCMNNLKQLGLVCKMFAVEQKDFFPALSSEAGRLMFLHADDPVTNEKCVYPSYLSDLNILVCPNDPQATSLTKPENKGNAKLLIDDHSYFYLGHVVTNDENVRNFVQAYKEAAKDKRDLAGDMMSVPAGKGTAGGDKIPRLKEGAERFAITDINNPKAAACAQGNIPVLVERPGHHVPNGGNVLYMDGHVEFRKYPGAWPMTEATITALEELDKLRAQAPISKDGESAVGDLLKKAANPIQYRCDFVLMEPPGPGILPLPTPLPAKDVTVLPEGKRVVDLMAEQNLPGDAEMGRLREFRVLASPALMAMSGQPATIMVGQNVSSPRFQKAPDQSVKVEDRPQSVGIKMAVTVAPDGGPGSVGMDLSLELSQVVGMSSGGEAKADVNYKAISKRAAEGHFVLLSQEVGMSSDGEAKADMNNKVISKRAVESHFVLVEDREYLLVFGRDSGQPILLGVRVSPVRPEKPPKA